MSIPEEPLLIAPENVVEDVPLTVNVADANPLSTLLAMPAVPDVANAPIVTEFPLRRNIPALAELPSVTTLGDTALNAPVLPARSVPLATLMAPVKVFTVETNQIWADAVAIKDGHMVYVGGRQQKIM